MPAPMLAPLPPGIKLPAGATVRFTALDAATGLIVNGVAISTATIQVNNLGGQASAALASGPFMLVPGGTP